MGSSAGGLAMLALALVIGYLWWSGLAATFIATLTGKVQGS